MTDMQVTSEEPIVGWRAWRVVEVPGEPPGTGGEGYRVSNRLQALEEGNRSPQEWMPRRAPMAVCRSRIRRHRQNEVPVDYCSCGYGAWEGMAGLLASLLGRSLDGSVVGETELWGPVIRDGHGHVRAAFAYPRKLVVVRTDPYLLVDNVRQELAARYEVPVEVIPRQDLAELDRRP